MGDDGGSRLGISQSSTSIVAVIVDRKDRKMGENGKMVATLKQTRV